MNKKNRATAGKPIISRVSGFFTKKRMFKRIINKPIVSHSQYENNLITSHSSSSVVLNTTLAVLIVSQKFLKRLGGQLIDPLFFYPSSDLY